MSPPIYPPISRDPSFLNSLPCYVVFTLGSRPSFVDRLSREELSALAGSVHVWSCLPVELVRVMMRDTTVGRRLSIADVYRASKAMTAAKSLDSVSARGREKRS